MLLQLLQLLQEAPFGIFIGENLLISELIAEVSKYTCTVSPHAIREAEAFGFQDLPTSLFVLHELRDSFCMAISATMVCATVSIAVSILASFQYEVAERKETALRNLISTWEAQNCPPSTCLKSELYPLFSLM